MKPDDSDAIMEYEDKIKSAGKPERPVRELPPLASDTLENGSTTESSSSSSSSKKEAEPAEAEKPPKKQVKLFPPNFLHF